MKFPQNRFYKFSLLPRILILGGFLICGSEAWSNDWDIPENGDGFVSFYGPNEFILQPFASTTPMESHSSLALANSTQSHPLKDFKLTIRASTEQQMRMPNPNPWEVMTLFFNYKAETPQSKKSTNYLKLTEEGVELGTLNKTGQNFLATTQSRSWLLGKANTFVILKRGSHLEVSIDGDSVLSFTDNPSNPNPLSDLPGSIGVYTEDARIHVFSVKIEK